MPVSKSDKKKRQSARRMMAEIAAIPWAMEENALSAMFQALEEIADCGLVVSDFEGSGAEVNATAQSRLALIAGLDSAGDDSDSYSDRCVVADGVLYLMVAGGIHPKQNVFTVWYGHTALDVLRADLEKAVDDQNIKRIVMVFDSPGGSVFGLAETAEFIYQLRDKKPVEARVDGLCASAAYFLASACQVIEAGASNSIGSIGVIAVVASYVRALEEMGIDVKAITFGKNKGVGSPFKPLDQNSVSVLQKSVDAYGKQFVSAVARNRGVSAKKVMDEFGQGATFIASEAMAIGLIDRIRGAGDEMPVMDSVDDEADEPDGMAEQKQVGGNVGVIENAGIGVGDCVSRSEVNGMNITERIRSALFALGWIQKVDASDDVCVAALSGAAMAAGVEVPEEEQAVLDFIVGAKGGQQNQAVGGVGEMDQARAEGRKAERDRRAEIQARAQLMNAGRENPAVSQAMIDAAVDGDDDIDAIASNWAAQITGNNGPTTVQNPVGDAPVAVRVELGTAPIERFGEQVELALLDRCNLLQADERPANGFGDVSRMNLSMIAAESLRLTNPGLDTRWMTREQIALEALQSGSMARSSFFSGFSSSVAYNRPGSFPHIMSNLAGKILDRGMELAETTYQHWTARIPDVDDFKAKSIVAVGSFSTLDEIQNSREFTELKMDEELRSFIQAKRHGNKVGLTPEMVADDDLDAFVQQLLSLAYAHENTLNDMCVAILTGNPTLLDSIALFNASHGNLVSGGGAPSAGQAKKHRILHQQATGVGTNKTIKARPAICLVPTELEDEAKQTYYTLERLNEVKTAQTDATVNVHRGTCEVYTEPDLDASSTAEWYTFADPMKLRSICVVFQTGYGRGGQREQWYDPNSKTRWISMEGRFGASASNYRGVVKNPGS